MEVWPEDEQASPGLLIRYGRVLNSLALGDASGVLERAIDVALSSGDRGAAAEAEALLCEMHWLMGRRDAAFEHLRVAEELVENEPSSYAKAYVMASASRFWMLAASDDAIRVGLQALAMAEELGLEELQAHALDNIGVSRIGKDDERGFADLERSIAIADSINSVESARAYGNLASALADFGELERGFEMLREARRRAERFGLDDWLLWLRGEVTYEPYCAGEWDEAFRQLDELIHEFEEHPFWMETPCRLLRGRMRLARGDTTGAIDDAERSLELAREAKDPQVLWPALAFSARIAAPSDPDRARLAVDEVLSEWRARDWPRWSESDWLADVAFVLPVLGGEKPLLEGLAEAGASSPWRKAALAYISGDPRTAADVFGGMGVGPEEAFARLRAAELLVGEGRRAEADDELERALTFWRAVGATAYVREGEALLAEAG